MIHWKEPKPLLYHFLAVYLDTEGTAHPIPRVIHDPGKTYPDADTCRQAILRQYQHALFQLGYKTPFLIKAIQVTQEGR